MFTATFARTAVVLWLCICLCQGDGDDGSAQDSSRFRNHHVRTKSGSATQQRTKDLTAGMPVTLSVKTSGEINKDGSSNSDDGVNNGQNVGILRDYLVRRPTNIFKSLMRTGVDAVQTSMDAFQGVSSNVFRVVRQKISTTPRSIPVVRSTPILSDENGSSSSSADNTKPTAPNKSEAIVNQPKHGLIKNIGHSVASILDTGIMGIEQATDFGFLMGNIGTHKIRATLDGKNGNNEIFKLLVKYLASRVGMGTKGSPRQFINDIGTISYFMAHNDEVTKSISTMMECFMENPQVNAAIIRMAVTFLESSPSTSCILDQLPLSPSDIRMVFDVFVGDNGHAMLKTIAGLVSDLTTGPDTKAFLESMLSMMSMFKSDDKETENSTKPTSMYGSLTSFFTAAGDEDDDDDDESDDKKTKPQWKKTNKNRVSSESISSETTVKPPPRKLTVTPNVTPNDAWFSSKTGGSGTIAKPSPIKKINPNDAWFSSSTSGSGTLTKASPKKKTVTADNTWFSNSIEGGETTGKSLAKKKNVIVDDSWFSNESTTNTIPKTSNTRSLNNGKNKSKTKYKTTKNNDIDDDDDNKSARDSSSSNRKISKKKKLKSKRPIPVNSSNEFVSDEDE